jgi:hypothetical protein
MSAFRRDSGMFAIANPLRGRCEAPPNTQANYTIW